MTREKSSEFRVPGSELHRCGVLLANAEPGTRNPEPGTVHPELVFRFRCSPAMLKLLARWTGWR
jgi:hypothetical protein